MATLVLTIGVAVPPAVEAASLAVSTTPRGVEARLVGRSTIGGVRFRLDGRQVGVRHHAPYSIKLAAAVSGHHTVTAAEAGSGRLIARAAFGTAAASRPAPTLTLTQVPSDPTQTTAASIAWTTTRATVVRCIVDGGRRDRCSSPLNLTGLRQGVHSVAITASNPNGSASAKAGWTVAASATPPPPPPSPSEPTVTFDSQPVGPTTATSATLAWHVTNATSASCSLDGAAATACTSPDPLSGLTTGQHVFVVAVTGPGGQASASASWTVTPPSAPPPASVQLSSPSSGSALSGLTALSATASTSSGRVAWVDFLVDGQVVGSDSVAPYGYVLDAARLTGGTHLLQVAAWGDDGSRSLSESVTVTSDPTPHYTVDAGSYPGLSAAIAALGGHPGSVHVPAGTYAVADLTVPTGVHLVGSGPTTILRAPAGSNPASVLKIASPNVAVSDLTVDANGAAQSSKGGWGVQIAPGAHDVLLQHLTIVGADDAGVYMWGDHTDVSVQDSLVDGGSTTSAGIGDHIGDTTSGETSVLRTTVRHTVDYGIELFPWTPQRSYPGEHAVVAFDTVQDVENPATYNGTNEGGIWSGGQDALIFSNIVDGTGWDGIETFGDSNHDHILHNVITNTLVGIYLEHSTNDSLVAGNTISAVSDTGIDVEWLNNGEGSQRNTFVGNTISGAPTGIFLDEGDNDNVVDSNSINDSRVRAIALQGSSGNVVRNNDLGDSQHHQAYGVQEMSAVTDTGSPVTPDGNQVTGNDARGSTSGAVLLLGSSSVASGNIWP